MQTLMHMCTATRVAPSGLVPTIVAFGLVPHMWESAGKGTCGVHAFISVPTKELVNLLHE
jgi:hypothetical protein